MHRSMYKSGTIQENLDKSRELSLKDTGFENYNPQSESITCSDPSGDPT